MLRIGCLFDDIRNGWVKEEIHDGIGWVFGRISTVKNGWMFGWIYPADITWSLVEDPFGVFEETETVANRCLLELADFISLLHLCWIWLFFRPFPLKLGFILTALVEPLLLRLVKSFFFASTKQSKVISRFNATANACSHIKCHTLDLHLHCRRFLFLRFGDIINTLNTKLKKWPNTLKQFVGNLPTNFLSVFGHFMGLALKGLKADQKCCSLPFSFSHQKRQQLLHH